MLRKYALKWGVEQPSGSPIHVSIGAFSTLLAVTAPDWLLDYGGKVLFAVVTAVVTSTISALISRKLNPPRSK
jgi:hypothetical protein